MLRPVFHSARGQAVMGAWHVKTPEGNTRIRGLTKQTLEKTFYPHYKVVKRKRGNSSTEIGKRVHKEVERWVEGSPQTTAKLHRYTVQVQDTLKKYKLEPIACEVPLLSFHGMYLTQADLLCCHTRPLDKKKQLVVVSLKTGYHAGMTKAQGKCLKSAGLLPNSFETHNFLQLASEVYVLQHEYRVPVSHALMLYVGFGASKKAHIQRLPRWGWNRAYMEKLHSDMRTTCDKKQVRALRALRAEIGAATKA